MAQKYSFYKDLPSWAKGVFVIGVGLVGYIVLNKVYKGIKGVADKSKEGKTTRDIQQELKDLQNQGVRKNFADSQYKAWADIIEQQFDGCDFKQNVFDMSDPLLGWAGSFSGSGKLVAGIFNQLKNNTDFAALVAAYGVRTYDQCGIWTGNVTGNLYKAISDELDEGERRELNKKLATKGITYKV
jgi:hypothetical protein